jgi:hypothetical protein
VLRRIFGPNEIVGNLRKLHCEEFHNLRLSQNVIRMITVRRMLWAVHEARIGEKMNAYRVLVGKPERKRPLGKPRHRWEGIKMDVREIWWGGVDWIRLSQDRDQWMALVNTVMNFRVP